MRLLHYSSLGIIGCLMVPGIASAYIQLTYVDSVDPETRASVEQTCRAQVGLSETETGTLLFQVRRCIRKFEQHEENKALAERRLNRASIRLEMQSKRSELLTNQTTRYRNRLIEQNRNVRIRQARNQRGTIGERLRTYRNRDRQEVRSRERVIQLQRGQRAEVRKEARKLCESYTGAQRVMCIREKIREAQRR